MARQRESNHRGLRVDARLSAAPALGSHGLAERFVANLAVNAIRHNLPGGWIPEVTDSRDGHAAITVANSGPERCGTT